MTTVIGIRFKDSGKIYHFAPGDVALAVGDWAIVETVRGPELGRVAAQPADMPPDRLIGELKPVLRRAAQSDMDRLAHFQQYTDEALEICKDKVAEHKLPMNLIKAEYNFDGSRLTFFFTSDKRVDFRALVRDLARTFHTRIELRQVGPRDEAKLLGGIGPCGRLLCCATFLPDFARVSIKMAKDQDLPLNPVKISGVCGRLLCCLSYEHEQYLDIKGELPSRGDWVQTPEGPGEVVSVNVVRETVTVELTTGTSIDCTAAQIGELTERVAAEARARNAAGITPIARGLHHADSVAEADLDLLAALEDQPPPRPAVRADVALMPSRERGPARPPRSERPPATTSPAEPQTPSSDGPRRRPRGRHAPVESASGTTHPKVGSPAPQSRRQALEKNARSGAPNQESASTEQQSSQRSRHRRRGRGGDGK